MRVVIVVFNLPVPDDQRVWAQAKALQRRGKAVTVICPALRGKAPGSRELEGISVRYFKITEADSALGSAREFLWMLRALCSSRRELRAADVVQVCNPPDLGFFCWALTRGSGSAIVYDHHDSVPLLAVLTPLRRLMPMFRLLENLTVRTADVVLVASEEQRLRMSRELGAQAVLIRSATSAALQQTASAKRLAAPVAVGFAGVLGRQDGALDLVDAMALVKSPHVVLHVAGDGGGAAELAAKVRDEGLASRVILHGWLTGPQLADFYASLTAVVVPDPVNDFNHGCAMNKVSNALRCGLPIISRPLREVLRMAGAAVVTADGNSVESLARAIDFFGSLPEVEVHAMRKAATDAYAQALDWASYEETYTQAIDQAVNLAQGPAR
jgi:glycosyltransferase involved in cell wall biosynthesis